MAAPATTADIARAFTAAWTSKNMDTAATYVTDDVVFDGPLGHVEGKNAYIESLKGLSQALEVTGAEIMAAFGDDSQALIMYQLMTECFGMLLCAKLFSFQGDKIQLDRLTFDASEIRKSQS